MVSELGKVRPLVQILFIQRYMSLLLQHSVMLLFKPQPNPYKPFSAAGTSVPHDTGDATRSRSHPGVLAATPVFSAIWQISQRHWNGGISSELASMSFEQAS